MLEFLIIWLGLAVAVGFLAHRYGRSGIVWVFIAAVVSPLIAGILLLAVGVRGKTCPECAETVRYGAAVCKHCGHDFPPA